MNTPSTPWLIVGQGLAGSCLAWEFYRRNIPFEITDSNTSQSSKIAAGMINPITGKNFQPSWRITEFHPPAIHFFTTLEHQLGIQLWHPLPILRLASSENEWRKIHSKLTSPDITPWLHPGETHTPDGFAGAVTLTGGGRLDTLTFVNSTREFFTNYGNYRNSSHNTSLPHPARILCQGAPGLLHNQLGPHRCAKGEIITLRAPWPQTHIRVGSGGWLIPLGNSLFRAGSTYQWDTLDQSPTTTGHTRISQIIHTLGGTDYTLIDHVAAIRPILRRSQPLIGKNPSGDWIFNALGSKGSLYAPAFSQLLADWILNGTRPHEDFIFSPP